MTDFELKAGLDSGSSFEFDFDFDFERGFEAPSVHQNDLRRLLVLVQLPGRQRPALLARKRVVCCYAARYLGFS